MITVPKANTNYCGNSNAYYSHWVDDDFIPGAWLKPITGQMTCGEKSKHDTKLVPDFKHDTKLMLCFFVLF